MVKAQSPKPCTAVSCRPKESSEVLHTIYRKSIAITRRQEDESTVVSQLIENLRTVVPTISHVQKEKVSELEIMQHAINYIYDLSNALSRPNASQHKSSDGTELADNTPMIDSRPNVVIRSNVVPAPAVNSTASVPSASCRPMAAQVC